MAPYTGSIASALSHNEPGKTDLAVETIFLFFNFICTGFRLWGRRVQNTRLQVNDYLIITALIIVTAQYAVMVALVVGYGLGLHADEVERIGGPGKLVVFRKLIYVIDLMWITLVTLIKLSILHFYSVVFSTKRFRYIVHGVMALAIAFWIAAFFSNVFFCTPPQKYWLPDIPGHCGNTAIFHIVLASIDLSISIIIIALPMPILWKLQLATAKRLGLMFLFGLGVVIILITSVRIGLFRDLEPADITYTYSKTAVLSSLVPLLGILNANLPISGPALLRVVKSSSLSSRTKRSSYTTSSDNFQRPRKEYDIRYSEVSHNFSNADDVGNKSRKI